MSIFSKLFGKKTEEAAPNSAIIEAYNKITPEHREKLFYGNIHSANHILTNMAKEAFGTANHQHIALCSDIYLQVWIRARSGLDIQFSVPAYIKEALCDRFSSIDPQIVAKCVDYSLNVIYLHEPKLKERITAYLYLTSITQKSASQNQSIEDLNLHDSQYGLVPDKPVFVNGFGSDKEYLSHLHTSDGIPLSFSRICSLQIDGIAGNVDMYKLLLEDGSEYSKIYLCNYGTRTNNITPPNLKYI